MAPASNTPIHFQCPKCGKKFSAPQTLGGKQLKCVGCGETYQVPGVATQLQPNAKSTGAGSIGNEATANRWIRRGDKVTGPIDEAKFEELSKSGRISPLDFCGTSADGPWSIVPSRYRDFLATGGWFYHQEGWVADATLGPVTGSQLVRLLIEEKITNESAVCQGGPWIFVKATPCAAIAKVELALRALEHKEAMAATREQQRLAAEAHRREKEEQRKQAEQKRLEAEQEKQQRMAQQAQAAAMAHQVNNGSAVGAGYGGAFVGQPHMAATYGAAAQQPTYPHRRSWVWVTIIGLLGLGALAVGGAVVFWPAATGWYGDAVREVSSVVPAARAIAPPPLVSKSEVDAIISQTQVNDISSKNVNQQIATYSRGCMRMSSLVAISCRAEKAVVGSKLSSAEISEIGADTVFQQTAVFLQGLQGLLAEAATSAGVNSSEVSSILSSVRVSEITSKTVHQQCANYYSGCLRLVELLAIHERASSSSVQVVMSSVRLNDTTAKTVHHQKVAYLTGICDLLSLAAKARGASDVDVEVVMSEMRLADIGADTVFQQEVGRLRATMKLMGIFAACR